MRFYDLMTIFWAAVWGVAVGWLILGLADDAPAALPLAVIGVVAMAVCVVFWRIFKDPG